MAGGLSVVSALPPAIMPIATYAASEAPKLSQLKALRDLGLSEQARRAFFEGKAVLIEIPTSGGLPTIATLQLSSNRLTAGIFSVHNQSGGGFQAFANFRAIARGLSRMFGVEELELQGIAVHNPKIEEILLRQGFMQSTITIPEEFNMGTGTVEIFSKVFPVF